MIKSLRNLKNLLICCAAGIVSGCGKVAYDLNSPKATVMPPVKSSEVLSVAVDTIFNILSNSLLEITMVIIAIVLYLRYLAFKRQQHRITPAQKNRNFVNFKTEERAWHFNEEDKQ